MKQLKLITAVIAAFVCMNFVFAESPLIGDVDSFVKIKVLQISKNVQLTDSQKIMI